MRDPNRLYGFYAEIADIHAKRFPDLREGQLWEIFTDWVKRFKSKDPFYLETNEMLKLFKEFAEEIS